MRLVKCLVNSIEWAKKFVWGFSLRCYRTNFSANTINTLGGSDGKESACSAGDQGLIPGSGRFPGQGNGKPLQYYCLENPHGQRSLAGYSPWGHTELDTTEVNNMFNMFIKYPTATLMYLTPALTRCLARTCIMLHSGISLGFGGPGWLQKSFSLLDTLPIMARCGLWGFLTWPGPN